MMMASFLRNFASGLCLTQVEKVRCMTRILRLGRLSIRRDHN